MQATPDFLLVAAAPLPVVHGLNQLAGKQIYVHVSPACHGFRAAVQRGAGALLHCGKTASTCRRTGVTTSGGALRMYSRAIVLVGSASEPR